MFRSRNFYFRLRGNLALFTNPATKGGGERSSYSVPTRQALQGIVDAIYFKPTITNVVTEVKVCNQIQTELHGVRALLANYRSDLSYVSYLSDVEYLVKFHFIWNEDRPDLLYDRLPNKHEAIMERSIRKGGRRDIFLGTRECLGLVDDICQEDYEQAEVAYAGQTIDFGMMFHSFKYPKDKSESLKSYFAHIVMENGCIRFKEQKDCEIMNTLSSYAFKAPNQIKSADEEFAIYQADEESEKGGN
ncbi:type I-C CRISPR-associated protein Cas5c [Streptococcus pseudoporcinus]|uniref:pre-crRNA processing endonuclease n=1 Tax=Streptococcus pseudoporcinus LQ 940-04 TaxID=875093 RepID=G5K9U4_9STRE|nr:type I-C CRISPR-associated protein Cas5c [Streptococcus pseudoporcinus]EFR44859.1 CRISPR-associated protein Cas5, Dvulg subtype [Streptococcus pseudoporcinus SPIN 20026]EHI65394.1 CRISPR-associated protein Cas5, subtype I-C/DVULG [Streptococcus pseudoporcinus LQ 940-04]VEF93468.1 CRISPR-associated protein [Streptococcus pseudoporcinus]